MSGAIYPFPRFLASFPDLCSCYRPIAMWTLRRKILFTMIGAMAILIILVYLFADRIASTTLQRLEEQISRQNVTRVAHTIQNELANLERTSADYAKWDDTYQFIEQ